MYTCWPGSPYTAVGGARSKRPATKPIHWSPWRNPSPLPSLDDTSWRASSVQSRSPGFVSPSLLSPVSRQKTNTKKTNVPTQKRSTSYCTYKRQKKSKSKRCSRDKNAKAMDTLCYMGNPNEKTGRTVCRMNPRMRRSPKRYVSPDHCSFSSEKHTCRRDKSATAMDPRCRMSEPMGRKRLRYCRVIAGSP